MSAPAVIAPPRIALDVAGVRIAGAEATRLVSWQVRQCVGAPDQVEIVFRDQAPAALRPDAELRLGVESSRAPLFTGKISAIEHVLRSDGSLLIRARGYDRLHQLRIRSHVKAWTDASAASVAKELAGDAGLSVQAEADGPTMPRAIQRGQSDLDFLLSLAARAGLGVHARQDTVHLYHLSDGIGTEIELQWGTALREARIDENPTAGPRPIHVQGEDVTRGAPLDHEDGDGDGATYDLAGAAVLSRDDPASLARAARARQVAAAWVLRGSAAGDPLLRPGAKVRTLTPEGRAGLGRLSRTFVLTEVVHAMDDAAGFVSTLSSEPRPAPVAGAAGSGPAAGAGASLSLATVTRVDDPDGAGRVKVTLDAYGDTETEWLPVLTPGASSTAGLIAQPDVDDHVLVLGSGLDPGWGVVLGGLYLDKLPEDVVDQGRSRRQLWRTSGGLRVSLDDVAKSITLADDAGSTVKIEPELVTISAIGDMHLTAAGKAIVITANTVDFVQG